jgi:hypothetical protein
MNFNNNNNQNLDGAGLNQGYGKGEEYGFSGTQISRETQGMEEITVGGINPTPQDPQDTPWETRSTHQGD